MAVWRDIQVQVGGCQYCPAKNSVNGYKTMVDRNLGARRAVIDLNCDHHEPWTISVRATDGPSSHPRVSQVCAALRRQLPGAKFFLLGPVSVHGLRAVDLSREPARYPGLPALAGAATVSLGHS